MDPRKCLIEALLDSKTYPHAVSLPIRHFETHISDIFLTGAYAYKIKKPVVFEFLDFSSLERRKFFCERELLRNARFAPRLYEAVVPVVRHGPNFKVGGSGTAVEYAVRMKQFDEDTLFSKLITKGKVTRAMLAQITDEICSLHRDAAKTPGFWDFPSVSKIILDNIDVLRGFVPEVFSAAEVEGLEAGFRKSLDSSRSIIAKRQRTHVRTVHGDLHLNNICMFEGKPTLFDGIEFNDNYSNCDCLADLAFLLMDLQFRGHYSDATCVLNRYLEQSDDYEGLLLLRLYIAYRAAVRAKVNCLTLSSVHSPAEKQNNVELAQRYVSLAIESIAEGAAASALKMVAIGGFSGSGKSTVADELAVAMNAVRVNSDTLRKHLCGVKLTERAPSSAYTSAVTDKTYHGLYERAQFALSAGLSVIIDATFLEPHFRSACENLARHAGVSFHGLWCTAPRDVITKRLTERTGAISDANIEVFHSQQQKDIGPMTWRILETVGPVAKIAEDIVVKTLNSDASSA